MDNRVSIVECDNYDEELVYNSVKSAIDLLGGINSFVSAGQVVALKPNLIGLKAPDAAATTHPSVVKAVGRLCLEAGAAKCIICDSAGGPYNKAFMGGVYKISGMSEVAKTDGIELNNDYSSYEVNTPEALVGKKYFINNTLAEADVVINIAKLKTHSFTGYSGAVKNMFGAIPGLVKVEMHGRFQNLTNFNNYMYDIQDYFKPKLVLHIMDAIVGMEGPGPMAGSPKKIGAVTASCNPLAADIAALRMISFAELKTNPTIREGINRGYMGKDMKLEILGADLKKWSGLKFKQPYIDEHTELASKMPQWVRNLLYLVMAQRPTIKPGKCKGCNKCIDHCPVHAMEIKAAKKKQKHGHVKIVYNKCIRCYCCQELCPFHVVKVKSGVFYKLLRFGKRRVKKERK
ncbi:MAG: DUF362 domain-containing protein [Firmicutes bacterium]|nr:DUF362 domain-containing protein [Bacillota bacterium]